MLSGGRGIVSTDGLYWLPMVTTALPLPHGAIDSTLGMVLNLQDHEKEIQITLYLSNERASGERETIQR